MVIDSNPHNMKIMSASTLVINSAVKRRCFTLIEMFLVFTLLVMIGGLLSFNLQKGLENERYLRGVREVAARLQIAQQLMYLAQVDFKITLTQTNQGLVCVLAPMQDLSSLFTHLLQSKTPLSGIHSIAWHDLDGQEITQGPIELTFFSRGAIVSRGELTLSSRDQLQSRFLLLSGNGRPVDDISLKPRFKELQETFADTHLQQQLYPAQLREWVSRIQQKAVP